MHAETSLGTSSFKNVLNALLLTKFSTQGSHPSLISLLTRVALYCIEVVIDIGEIFITLEEEEHVVSRGHLRM